MLKAPNFSLRVGNDIYFNQLRIGETMEKMAAAGVDYAPEVAEYASKLKTTPGKMYVLINAMGAYEYWGLNINGDAFKEEEFVVKKRHETFVTHGHPYRNHVNKDPNKSYGKILFAAYNTRMHRVELICEFDEGQASDICERIARGEDVRVSMGCKVKFDICTICGKQSKVQEDYCDHLKYQMRQIFPDGRVVGAINPDPVFFDISVVWIPADKAARVLHKIASDLSMYKNIGGCSNVESSVHAAAKLGFMEELVYNKQASIHKLSDIAKRAIQTKKADIEKEIEGNVIGPAEAEDVAEASKNGIKLLREEEPEIPNRVLDHVGCNYPMKRIMASLGMLGIVPKPREFQRMMLMSLGEKGMADDFDSRGVDFSQIMDQVQGMDPSSSPLSQMATPDDMTADSFIPELIKLLGGNIQDKSYYAVPAAKRLIKITIIMQPKTASVKPMVKKAADIGYLTALALAYLAAKSGTLKKLNENGIGGGQVDKLFQKYPELLTTLLMAGGEMVPSVLRATSSANNNTGKTYPSDYLYAKEQYEGSKKEAMVKVAFNADFIRSMGINPQQSLVSAALVPQIATHFGKGYIEAQEDSKMRRGERPEGNMLTDIVKKYPGYVGLGLSALGLKYGIF